MKAVRYTMALLAGMMVFIFSSPAVVAQQPQKQTSTLERLQEAHEGEKNATARYEAFAKKAQEEGYGEVASLFRAAANAEGVHAKRFAEVITKMGATPQAQVTPPEVNSTKENLQMALGAESKEREELYPKYMKQARQEGNKDAAEAFRYAMSAEGDHAKFYKQALENLDDWKGESKSFYVCQECGRTVTEVPKDKCPVCEEPPSMYKEVN